MVAPKMPIHLQWLGLHLHFPFVYFSMRLMYDAKTCDNPAQIVCRLKNGSLYHEYFPIPVKINNEAVELIVFGKE
jgi:hypothetical protein